MRAVIPARQGTDRPCVIYWTGRVRLHVEVLTYCQQSLEAVAGVLQVPDDTPCCTECERRVEAKDFPKVR